MTESKNILEFSDVSLQKNLLRGQAEMRELAFKAGQGALLLIKVEAGNEYLPLADAAEGLLVPDAGVIRWQGKEWRDLEPEDELRARSRIGRVYEKQAWISNLNVDENVTLARRHHTELPEKEIVAAADALAGRFGIQEVPRQRPAFAAKRDLKIAEWVRAFLCDPLLLLLERPETGVTDESLPKLIDAVQDAREHGTAVIWQTDRDVVWTAAKLSGALRYRMRGTNMILTEENKS